jgi:8-oxo-dGTP pyrophosphatase MutT (NUDIX family)
MTGDFDDVVRAAGGVVARSGHAGGLEILIVHRPRYDDWTLPKGKAEPGETDEACALREVEEETSLVCTLGDEVAVTRYEDARGRPKRVRYFWMTPADDGEASPQNEVDAVRWATQEAALEALSYARDRDVVSRLPSSWPASA